MINKHALIIFIKNPVLGKVKTRIAATVGDELALAIYQELQNHTRKLLLKTKGIDLHLFYDQEISTVDDWSPHQFMKHVQSKGDLGQRMASAFKSLCAKYDSTLIIGSDCISLKESHIMEAIELLKEKEVVIGPTYDGGYYLLGMHDFHNELFQDVPWSTDEVCELTIKRIVDKGESYALLEKLSDIDYYDDWLKFGYPL